MSKLWKALEESSFLRREWCGGKYPDNYNVWVASGAVDLNLDFVCIHPINGGGINFGEHGGLVVKHIRGGNEAINSAKPWENKVPRISAELKDLVLFERGCADR